MSVAKSKTVIFKPVEQRLDGGVVLRGWCSEPRQRPVIAFLHGNGFCGAAYFPMLEALHEHFDIIMLDIPGHGRSDGINPYAGWNQTAEIMHEGLKKLSPRYGQPVFGVGHSLGGVLTALSAHRHPHSYQALLLLDPVLFPRRMLLTMKVLAWLRMTAYVHPFVKPTLKRRYQWESRQAAFDYLHDRKIYRGWTDSALQSFIDHGLQENQQGGVSLCCSPALEAHYFSTLPDGLWRSLNSLTGTVLLLMGESSYPFSLQAARSAEKQNANIQLSMVPGEHCFMQVSPQQTADRIIRALAGVDTKPL